MILRCLMLRCLLIPSGCLAGALSLNAAITNCPPPTYPAPYTEQGFEAIWSPATCAWEIVPDGESPIAIDTKGNWGKSEQFTDPSKVYVSFDMRGDGKIGKFSWPKSDSGIAWLALDRDGDGIVKDGTELFGNFTPHADGGVKNHPSPNGFLALAWYDQPGQGGNQDLVIDKNDAIWPKLKLWIDKHCYTTPDTPCTSYPEELYELESEGITSISLVYGSDDRFDAVGNEDKFQSLLNPEKKTDAQHSKDGRQAIDVRLKRVDTEQ